MCTVISNYPSALSWFIFRQWRKIFFVDAKRAAARPCLTRFILRRANIVESVGATWPFHKRPRDDVKLSYDRLAHWLEKTDMGDKISDLIFEM
jgi:hypothetical protein